jgi:hypothetical protein
MKLFTLAFLTGVMVLPVSVFAQEVPMTSRRQEVGEVRQAQRIDRACERILAQEERILTRLSDHQNRTGSFFESRDGRMDGRVENRLSNQSDRRDNRDERADIRFEDLRARFADQEASVLVFENAVNEALIVHRARVDEARQNFLTERDMIQNTYRADLGVYWASAEAQVQSLFANARELCQIGNTQEAVAMIREGLGAIRNADQGIRLEQIKQDIDELSERTRQVIQSSRTQLQSDIEAARSAFLASVGE